MRKSEPEATPAKPARVRRNELETERRAITEKIIALEAQGFLPSAIPDPSHAVHDRALRLITGDETAVVSVADGAVELQHLYDERAAIDRALEMLAQQAAAEEAARLRAAMAAERPEILAAARKRCLLAIALRQANFEFEVFRRKYSRIGGDLPSAQYSLLGIGRDRGDLRGEVDACAREMVRLGIITKKESGLDD